MIWPENGGLLRLTDRHLGPSVQRWSRSPLGLYNSLYIRSVSVPWQIEIEPEVRQWLELLPDRHYDKAERVADMLASRPTTLSEPYSRHLGGKVRELRFSHDGNAVRITYWLAPRQRIVLLTVFRKTRQHEEAEIERARQAQKVCEAEHVLAEHTYDRSKEDTP